MTTFLQFVAVTALGLLTAWLVHQYFGAFGNSWTSFGIGFGLLLAIGLIVDRRRAQKRQQDKQGWPERD